MTRKAFVLIFTLLLSIAFASASTLDIVTPLNSYDNFLSVQDLSFMTCSSSTTEPVSYILCEDNYNKVDLVNYKWNDSCYITAYNPSKFDCSSLKIISEINSEYLSKSIPLKKTIILPNNILLKQEWDGGFGDAKDTAAAIWLLSDFGDKYSDEIDMAFDWLKRNRHNSEKCWPSPSCSTETTAKVMAYLTLAGYDDSNGVFYDGKVWLERHQNYIGGTWYALLNSDEDEGEVDCNLTVGGTRTLYTGINTSHTEEIEITVDYGDEIIFNCSDTASITLLDHRNLSVFYGKSSDAITFSFPSGACWSSNDWRGCSDHITVYATIANLSKTRRDEAKSYLEAKLVDDDYTGQYIPSSLPLMDSAMYYLYIDNPSTIVRHLIFEQNNDGSYGEGTLTEVAKRTMTIVMALEKDNYTFTKDTIDDAREWLSTKTKSYGYSDILADTLSYFIFKNKDRKILVATPNMVEVNGDTVVSLYNPSLFDYDDINITISNSINNIIKVSSLDNIHNFSTINLTIKKKDISAGHYSGYITINDSSSLLLKLPVVILEEPHISYDVQKLVRLLGTQGKIRLSNINANDDFDCTMFFDDPSLQGIPFTINRGDKSSTINFILSEAGRKTADYPGKINCSNGKDSFSNDFAVTIDLYPQKIFDVNKELLKVKRRTYNPKIKILNNLNEQIVVSAQLDEVMDIYYKIEENTLTIPPLSSDYLIIESSVPSKENITFSGNIIISSLEQKITIPVEVNVKYVPFMKSLFVKIVLYLLLLIAILFVSYAIYVYWPEIMSFLLGAEKKAEKSSRSVSKLFMGIMPSRVKHWFNMDENKEVTVTEEDEAGKYQGVVDIIRIMMSLNKDVTEIRKALKKENMSDKEIDEAIKIVNEELSAEEQIHKEESVINVLKKMDEDADLIRGTLKQSGYSDGEINSTFEEIEGELAEKEKKLHDHLVALKGEDEQEEVSLLDIEKEKAGMNEEKKK